MIKQYLICRTLTLRNRFGSKFMYNTYEIVEAQTKEFAKIQMFSEEDLVAKAFINVNKSILEFASVKISKPTVLIINKLSTDYLKSIYNEMRVKKIPFSVYECAC